MPDETSFNESFDLLSKVVKAGRSENQLLSGEKLSAVYKTVQQATRERSAKLEAHLQLSNDAIRNLTAVEAKRILNSAQVETVNGIDRAKLKTRFEQVSAVSGEKLATKAVGEAIRGWKPRERRVANSLKRLSTTKNVKKEDSIKNERRRSL